mmetsp:Transcript_27130/g.88992  ORF Transcript_27130/g.88992 Transcript_27130/m.88992 type:complete len:270 (-) Transcript_27130:94-903(-)
MATPAPMRTPSPTFGWRSPDPVPVPPSVTLWRMETLFPTLAVSPTTSPVAWSMRMPQPIRAAGWMSTWNLDDTRDWSASASGRRPFSQSQCDTRCAWSAWNPLKKRRGCVYFSHAGSRSKTACKSARAASAILGSLSKASRKSCCSCVLSSVESPSLLARVKASAPSSELCASTVEYRNDASEGSATESSSASCLICSQRRCGVAGHVHLLRSAAAASAAASAELAASAVVPASRCCCEAPGARAPSRAARAVRHARAKDAHRGEVPAA